MYNILGYEKVSFCDWPDRLCSILFLGGCNFRCETCQNKSIAFGEEKLEELDIDQIIENIKSKKDWYGGITISGGEPTVSKNLLELVDLMREILPVKLDTNGSNPRVIEMLMDKVFLFAIDIKGPWEKYEELSGGCITEKKVRGNFESIFKLAKEYPKKFYFRTTTVPALTAEDVETIKTYLPEGFILNLQKYHSNL